MSDLVFDASQEAAINAALKNRIHLITGGAGTGKTSLVKEIASQTKGAMLCAPTGKAAARLREATGIESRTIHSYLQYNGSEFMVESLAGAHVIVDESSMVDSWLMGAIVTREPEQLTLVGDNAQLFPVGPGAPFHDLITLRPEYVSNLTTCYRSQEAVCAAGNKIRAGEFPGYAMSSPGENWTFMKARGPNETQQIIIDMVEAGEIDFERDIIVCPKNGRMDKSSGNYETCTVNALNPLIRDIANPHYEGQKFDVGDRVICTENFAEEDVWNGTTGTITAVDYNNQIWVKTDTPTRDGYSGWQDETLFDKDMTKATRHAYALTIHKSQGSQYRKVIVACLNRDTIMLSRPLIYTAVTRAQKECIVIGERWAFDRAITNAPIRKTVMQEIARQQKGA